MPPEHDLNVLGSVAGKDILEIACGGGQSAVYLAEQGARVTGVDFSSEQLAHARAFARSKDVDVRFVESNVEDLSLLEDARFDIAFSAYALGFVEHVREAFREIARVLRPGGLFAFSWMSPMYAVTEDGSLTIRRSYFDRSPLIDTDEDGTEVAFHRTYGDWHRELTDAGFRRHGHPGTGPSAKGKLVRRHVPSREDPDDSRDDNLAGATTAPTRAVTSSAYNGFPHFRQKAASSDSRLPQLRHLTLTTSFGAAAAAVPPAAVIPRVAVRACCM